MSIKKHQNSDEILKMQYSARLTYNFAVICSVLSWGLTLTIIIIGWFYSKNHPEAVAYTIATLTIINAVVDYGRGKIIKMAASIRAYIDDKLFYFGNKAVYNGFTTFFINEYCNRITTMRKRTFEKQKKHSGTDKYKGVKDWYTLTDDLSREEEIIFAQKENCVFDKSISKYSIILIAIIFIVVLVCILKMDSKFLLICAFVPGVLKALRLWSDYRMTNKIVEEERKLISVIDVNGYDEKFILRLQECINERRTLDYVPLSFIHKLTSGILHKKVSNR